MHYYIVNNIDIELWGLSARERLRGLLSKIPDVAEVRSLSALNDNNPVLLLRADFLYDQEILTSLATRSNTLLHVEGESSPVAAIVPASDAQTVSKMMLAESKEEPVNHLEHVSPSDLMGGYEAQLLKRKTPRVLKVSSERRTLLENYLYDKSYKGITDFVTKFVWPRPARWFVRRCVAWGITPNMVTGFSWLLTLVVCVLFYFGYFVIGLSLAWFMTFLDTVDGKLARVTLNSSPLGHAMDHGLDIIHPPVWYWLWALGLGVQSVSCLSYEIQVMTLVWWMLAGYVGGRIAEGVFQLSSGGLSMFGWKPIDSYNRLITARRNPSLLILTIGVLFAAPDQGFVVLVLWTVLSTLFLAYRLVVGVLERLKTGPLISWLHDLSQEQIDQSFTARLFSGKRLDPRLM